MNKKKDTKQQTNYNFHGTTHINNSNLGIMQDSKINAPIENMNDIIYSKLKDKKTPFTPLHGKLAGIIGIAGSIASLLSAFYSLININQISHSFAQANLLLFIVSFLLIALLPYWIKLSKQGFIKPVFPFFPTLEVSEDKKIHVIKVYADCPICNGQIKLYNSNGNVTGICSKNPKHKFDFDHTNYTGKRL